MKKSTILNHRSQILFFTVAFALVGLLVIGCAQPLNPTSESNPNFTGKIAANLSFYTPKQYVAEGAGKAFSTFVKNSRYDKDDVLKSVESLGRYLKRSYIGYDIKSDYLKNSSDVLVENCKSFVAAGPEKFSVSEYYDVFERCVSQFMDGHLTVNRDFAYGHVISPIYSTWVVDGKLRISGLRKKLIARLEEIAKVSPGEYANRLKLGYEIVSIDGKDALEELREIELRISASSKLARQRYAASLLFDRYYRLPKRSDVTLVVKDFEGREETLVLPWILWENSGSSLSRKELLEAGVTNSTEVANQNSLLFVDSASINLTGMLFENIEGRQELYISSDLDDVAFDFGVATTSYGKLCYLRQYTFSLSMQSGGKFPVYKKSAGRDSVEVSLETQLKDFFARCESKKLALVYDLRNNHGGTELVGELIRKYLENPRGPKIFTASKFYLTPTLTSSSLSSFSKLNERAPFLFDKYKIDLLLNAQENSSKFTDWIIRRDYYQPDELVTPFTRPVFVLTGPRCMSQCESTVKELKENGRVTVLGEPTNGTGFGFLANKNVFHDELNLLHIDIPDMAFQSIGIGDISKIERDDYFYAGILPASSLNFLENSPIQPDFQYNYTLEDVTQKSKDFKQFVLGKVFGK